VLFRSLVQALGRRGLGEGGDGGLQVFGGGQCVAVAGLDQGGVVLGDRLVVDGGGRGCKGSGLGQGGCGPQGQRRKGQGGGGQGGTDHGKSLHKKANENDSILHIKRHKSLSGLAGTDRVRSADGADLHLFPQTLHVFRVCQAGAGVQQGG
jgi:hypothetical protein